MANIRGLWEADMETMMSTIEMTTKQPSMMFQPLDRYARRPHTNPSAHTCSETPFTWRRNQTFVLGACFLPSLSFFSFPLPSFNFPSLFPTSKCPLNPAKEFGGAFVSSPSRENEFAATRHVPLHRTEFL